MGANAGASMASSHGGEEADAAVQGAGPEVPRPAARVAAGSNHPGRLAIPLPPPTQDQVDGASVGTGFHRIWRCPRLDVPRQRHAPRGMLARARAEDLAGDVAFERALFPTLAASVPPPSGGGLI
jgi:hypothetical protein